MTQTYGEEKKPPGGSDRPVKSKEPAVPVYEAEIIDEEELTGKEVVSQGTRDAGAPVKKTEKLSYKIGKMAGAAAAFLGFLSEMAGVFRMGRKMGGNGSGGRGMGRGMGKGKGKGSGRGQRQRKRNFFAKQ